MSKILQTNIDDVVLQIPHVEKTEHPPKSYQPQPNTHEYLRQIFLANSLNIIKEKTDSHGNYMYCLDECVFDPSHRGNEAAICVAPSGMIFYQCFHNSCSGKRWEDVKAALQLPEKEKKTYYRKCQNCGGNFRSEYVSGSLELITDDGTIHFCQQQHVPADDGAQEPEEIEHIAKKKEIKLDTGKIHPVFMEFWNAIGETEAFREYVMTTFLVSVAQACGNRIMLKVGHGVRPNIYALLLGESTFMRKTTSMDYGLAALKKLSKGRKDHWLEEMDQYQEDLLKYSAMSKKEREAEEKPVRPVDESNIYPSEFSPEQLLEKMADRPDGLFAYSEIGRLLASLEVGYMAGFKEKLTEFFDGGSDSYIRETKSGGVVKIDKPCPNIVGCSTFEWLQKHLQKEDLLSGFLARFVFVTRRCFPEQEIAIPEFFTIDHKWARLLSYIEAFSGDVVLSQAAREIYSDWYSKFIAKAKDQDKFLHSFLGRLATVCHKIAIINHVLDEAHFGLAGEAPQLGRLEESHYRQAFPWIDMFASNIIECYEEITAGDSLGELKVMEIIRKRGKTEGKYIVLTQSKLCQYSHMKLSDIKEIFDTLLAKKYVVRIEKGKNRISWGILK